MNPFVSVIIPNYNHAKYLDDRLQSVLNQTYQNFEVIILDDSSTDKSVEVIEKYRHNEHVSVIHYNKINSGSPFVQWNHGFELAKGELIWIAESDDDCNITFLDKLVSKFENDANLVFSFCRSIEMDENGHRKNVLQSMFPIDIRVDGKIFNKKFQIWGNKIWNASSVVFRRDMAMSVDKQYMNFKGAGDWLFWIEMAERGNVAVIAEPCNYYRIYKDNTTAKMRLSGNEDVEDKKIYDYFCKNNYLSFIAKIRLRKKYIYSIRFVNNYKNELLRQKSLKLWNPSMFDWLLAYVSYLLHKS